MEVSIHICFQDPGARYHHYIVWAEEPTDWMLVPKGRVNCHDDPYTTKINTELRLMTNEIDVPSTRYFGASFLESSTSLFLSKKGLRKLDELNDYSSNIAVVKLYIGL